MGLMDYINGSETIQLQTLMEENEKERSETQNKESKFNWKFPLFGAIGFGVGFAIMYAITLTHLNMSTNALASSYPGTRIDPIVGIYRGLIVGAIGGATLGLGLNNKKKAFYLSCACAIGFAIGFYLVISVGNEIVLSIGRAIMGSLGYESESHSYLGWGIARGLGTGVIVGAIGGSVLGLALKKDKIVFALIFSFTSAIGFAIAFAIGYATYTGRLYSIWDGIGGGIGGATIGFTLALYNSIGRRDITSTGRKNLFQNL
jgi:hypothetical protein